MTIIHIFKKSVALKLVRNLLLESLIGRHSTTAKKIMGLSGLETSSQPKSTGAHDFQGNHSFLYCTRLVEIFVI